MFQLLGLGGHVARLLLLCTCAADRLGQGWHALLSGACGRGLTLGALL